MMRGFRYLLGSSAVWGAIFTQAAILGVYGFGPENPLSGSNLAADFSSSALNGGITGAVVPEPYHYGLAGVLGLFALVCRDWFRRRRMAVMHSSKAE